MVKLKVKYLTSLKDKTLGLIGKEFPSPLYFKTHFGIHTIGLKFPIDVIILDSRNKVVRLKENLAPNWIYFWPPFFNRVIELPLGTIKKEKIKIGSIINLLLSQ